jgi:hypothetical protein
MPQLSSSDAGLRRSIDSVNREVSRWIQATGMAA